MKKIMRKIKRSKIVKVIKSKQRREYLIVLLALLFATILLPIGASYSFLYGIGNSSIYSSALSLILIVLSFVLFILSFFAILVLPTAYYKTFGKKRARRRR